MPKQQRSIFVDTEEGSVIGMGQSSIDKKWFVMVKPKLKGDWLSLTGRYTKTEAEGIVKFLSSLKEKTLANLA